MTSVRCTWLSLTVLIFMATASAATPPLKAAKNFVSVRGAHFERSGARYAFVGTNLWYGMNLGSAGAGGDRARLVRELDRLKSLGVTNLRVLAGSEGPDSQPWRIVPALQASPGVYNAEVLAGLDFLFSEIKKRDLLAVVCLGNFWPWSGGMAQYLRWAGAHSIPYPPPHPGGSWEAFQSYTAKFYSNPRAVALFNNFIRLVVQRYSAEPALMAWELANEPRGGQNAAAYNAWVGHTADFIKSLDANHLVTIGSEGLTPWADAGTDPVRDHSFKSIDYMTIHIWAQNWSWFDPVKPEETFPVAVAKMKAYLHEHIQKATQIGRPLVVEEFGLGRDGGSYAPAATTRYRDRYYAEVFDEVYQAARSGGVVGGVNFWAWAGEATPRAPGDVWKPGDAFLGDPPHEFQGWYSVYLSDHSTLRLISDYAQKMSALK